MIGSIDSDRLRRHIADLVEEQLDAVARAGAGDELAELIRGYIGRPAKLVRPRVMWEAARSYGADDEERVLDLAAGIELLHVFALIHDDRIDGLGRDNRAITESRGDAALRVLAGDLLHAVAHGAIAQRVRRDGLPVALLETVRDASVVTVAGQVADMRYLKRGSPSPSLSSLFELYDVKTGYYSFVAPLRIGALAARPAVGTPEGLERFGLLLGRAFQLQDDAEDVLSAHQGDEDNLPPWHVNVLAAFDAEREGPVPAHVHGHAGSQHRSRAGGSRREPHRRQASGLDTEEFGAWVHRTVSQVLADAEEAAVQIVPPPDDEDVLVALARALLRGEA
jgi:hypothetical protein